MKPAGSASRKKVALVGGELGAFEAVDRRLHQLRHEAVFAGGLERLARLLGVGRTTRRRREAGCRPENGTIILFIAATDGKRADNAVQARSACAWLAKAPSWMTLPLPPVGAGLGLGFAALAPWLRSAGAGLRLRLGRLRGRPALRAAC